MWAHALVAVEHAMLTGTWHMFQTVEVYEDSGSNYSPETSSHVGSRGSCHTREPLTWGMTFRRDAVCLTDLSQSSETWLALSDGGLAWRTRKD